MQGVEAIIEGQQRVSTKRDDEEFLLSSSSADSTVECGTLGPIRQSSGLARLRHLATVFGLIPCRSLSAWIEAFDRCIAARMA